MRDKGTGVLKRLRAEANTLVTEAGTAVKSTIIRKKSSTRLNLPAETKKGDALSANVSLEITEYVQGTVTRPNVMYVMCILDGEVLYSMFHPDNGVLESSLHNNDFDGTDFFINHATNLDDLKRHIPELLKILLKRNEISLSVKKKPTSSASSPRENFSLEISAPVSIREMHHNVMYVTQFKENYFEYTVKDPDNIIRNDTIWSAEIDRSVHPQTTINELKEYETITKIYEILSRKKHIATHASPREQVIELASQDPDLSREFVECVQTNLLQQTRINQPPANRDMLIPLKFTSQEPILGSDRKAGSSSDETIESPSAVDMRTNDTPLWCTVSSPPPMDTPPEYSPRIDPCDFSPEIQSEAGIDSPILLVEKPYQILQEEHPVPAKALIPGQYLSKLQKNINRLTSDLKEVLFWNRDLKQEKLLGLLELHSKITNNTENSLYKIIKKVEKKHSRLRQGWFSETAKLLDKLDTLVSSSLNPEQRKNIEDLISNLKNERTGFFCSESDKTLKQHKINGLKAILKNAETMTLFEALNHANLQYPQLRNGRFSRTHSLLVAIEGSGDTFGLNHQ